MFDIIYFFFLAAIISFAGSLQLGPVNLNVIQTAINKNFKASLYVAIGGCIPEIIYCSFAFLSTEYIFRQSTLLLYFQIASILVFLIFGILSLKKNNASVEKSSSETFSFLSGFFLGMLNPMLITFWVSIILYLQQFSSILVTSISSKIAFIIGTAAGAFLLLLMFASLVTRNKSDFIQRNQKNINKLIGIIFIILAGIQFIKLFV